MLKKLTVIAAVFIAAATMYAQPVIKFYCGSTMYGAIKEMSDTFAKANNCKFDITKGGSGALWKELKNRKDGDLYLPGSDSYRKKHIGKGILLEYGGEEIGYNQAALIVQKGNPQGIKDLEALVNEDLKVFLCDPKLGSIGKNTEKVLKKYKGQDFFDAAYDNTYDVDKDAKAVTTQVASKKADVGVTWRATAFWGDFKSKVDVVEIDTKYAPKKKLIINLLGTSKNPDLAKKFMAFAISPEGKAIMKKYGFTE
jgi:molybdate transport system substrate-binding protein